MGGYASKQSDTQTVVSAGTGAGVQQQNANSSEGIKKALTEGNQLFLEKDVRDKIVQVADVMKAYGTSDYKMLMGEVNRLNEILKAKGQTEFQLSDQIQRSMMEFHKAMLTNLDGAQYANKQERDRALNSAYNDPEKYKRSIENIKSDAESVKKIFEHLNDYYGSDMKETLDGILTSPGLVDNKIMKDGVTNIISSVQNLKVKYRFFEYKYIQLNIFLILFIQKAYDSIDEFVKNVLAFNQQRDEMREKVIKDTLDAMIKILASADLQLKPEDFNYLNTMLDNIQKDIRRKEDALGQHLQDVKTITKNNLEGFVSALSEATKNDMSEILARRPQRGGFIRGSSMIPQPFYALDNPVMTEGTHPSPSTQ